MWYIRTVIEREMADIAELKTLIEGIQAALKDTATNEKIEELIRKIDEKDTPRFRHWKRESKCSRDELRS